MQLNKKILISMILILFILSIGAISAAGEDVASDGQLASVDNDISNSHIVESDVDESLDADAPISSSVDENCEVSTTVNNEDTVKASSVVEVTPSTYSNYFDNDGNIVSGISEGDIVDLSGKFINKKFIINTPLTITSSKVDAIFINSTIKVNSLGAGSNISYIKFNNSNDYGVGVTLNETSSVTISYIDFYGDGNGASGVFLVGTTLSKILNSKILTEPKGNDNQWTHPAILLKHSHNNTIFNNTILIGDNNGIYLSFYNDGGSSNYNQIINNTVKSIINNPTSWNYAIQLMGSYNLAENNTVIGTYRGITSANGVGNSIISNDLINITGVDYSTGGVTGGDYAIEVVADSIVKNNRIINGKVSAGIRIIGSNCNVTGNTVEITIASGRGIDIEADWAYVVGNNVSTTASSGIYVYGPVKNILIDTNIINTSSNGILIKKQSRLKYPTYINITNNDITTTSSVSINALESSNVIISQNLINGVLDSVDNSSIMFPDMQPGDDPGIITYNGTVHNINPESYDMYIAPDGNIITSMVKDGDILNFTGDFINKTIIVSSQVKITGNANFYNTTFRVTSPYVFIENIHITNNRIEGTNQYGIHIYEADYVYVNNTFINVTDKYAAYAIYIQDSTGSKIMSNTLISSGDYLTYTILGFEIYNTTIYDNKIYTNGTGEKHSYESSICIDGNGSCLDGQTCIDGNTGEGSCIDGQTCLDGETGGSCIDGDNSCTDGGHIIPEIYRTYGILLLYSSNNVVDYNTIEVTSKLNNTDLEDITNAIVGVDMYYNCFNNTIIHNIIIVYGNDPYMYGTGVLAAPTGTGTTQASRNKFIANDITIEGPYMATGIIIGYNSKDNIVDDNGIDIGSGVFAYGITLEASNYNNVTSNDVFADSGIIYLIEAFASSNNIISGNNLTASGNYIYGIAGSASKNNKIFNNYIEAKGTGGDVVNIFSHTDSIPKGIAGIILLTNATSNNIYSNHIITTGKYAVNISDSSNKVYNNYLQAASTCGNSAVSISNSNVYSNYPINTKFASVTTNVKYSQYFSVKLTDASGNPINGGKITVKIGSKTYNIKTNAKGIAQLKISLAASTYKNVQLSYAGVKDKYNSVSKKITLKVTKALTKFVSPTKKVKKGKKFSIVLKDQFNNKLASKKVKLTIGKKVYTVKTNKNGQISQKLTLKKADTLLK